MSNPYDPWPGGPGEPAPPPQPWPGSPPPMGDPPPAQFAPLALPTSGTPPEPQERDPLVAHLVWEGVLLLVVVVLLGIIVAISGGQGLNPLFLQAGSVGLVAAGLALSLRMGAPNLAVGAIAGMTGTFGAWLVLETGLPPMTAMVVAVVLATLAGLVAAGLVALLSVPSWAVTLALALILEMVAVGISGGQVLAVQFGSGGTVLWFWLFLAGSLGAGGLLRLPGVGRWLVPDRTAGQTARWMRPTLGMAVGLIGSSLLAGLAGVADVMRLQAATATGNGFLLTMTALAAVLLGGASIFGWRAGIAGTVLGVLTIVGAQVILNLNQAEFWVSTIVVGGALIVGLAVSRVKEILASG